MTKLMTTGLNPMQLAKVYRDVVLATKDLPISKDREKIKQIIKEEYKKQYPFSFMPKDDNEQTITTIYNNYGRIEQLSNQLGIENIEDLLKVIAKGAKPTKPRKPKETK